MDKIASVFFLQDKDCIKPVLSTTGEKIGENVDMTKYSFLAYFNEIFSITNLYTDFANILDEDEKVKASNFLYIINDIEAFDRNTLRYRARNEIICFLNEVIENYRNNKLSKIDALNKILWFYDYKELEEQERENLNMLQVKINELEETEEVIANFDFICNKIKKDENFLLVKMNEIKTKIENEYIEKFYIWLDYIKRLSFTLLYIEFTSNNQSFEVQRENSYRITDGQRTYKDVFRDLQIKLLCYYYSTKTMDKEKADFIYNEYKRDITEYQEKFVNERKQYSNRVEDLERKKLKLKEEYKINEYFKKNDELEKQKKLEDKEFEKKCFPFLFVGYEKEKSEIDKQIGKKNTAIDKIKTISEDEVQQKKQEKQEEIHMLLSTREGLKYSQFSAKCYYDEFNISQLKS